MGLITVLVSSPGKRHGNPVQYSCLFSLPWTKEPGRLQSVGSRRVGPDSSDLAHTVQVYPFMDPCLIMAKGLV